MQLAHHAVDQVLLDQVILAAADDAAVGRVVDLVAMDVQRSAAQHRGRRAGVVHADVVDVISGDQRVGAVDPDAAGADVMDAAVGDAAIGQVVAPDAQAAHVADLQPLQRALSRNGDAQRAVERARAETGRLERRGGGLQRQAAERDLLRLLLRVAGNADDPLADRGDDLALRHVLARQRPVDQAAGRAIEIPLAGLASCPRAC